MLSDFMEECTMLDRVSVPNGIGGFSYELRPGAPFDAAIVMDTSAPMRVAYGTGQATSYTVAVMKPTAFKRGDRFRRVRDGLTFEATSATRDMEAPPMASEGMQFGQFSAKVVEV